jgi:hypothetical protein
MLSRSDQETIINQFLAIFIFTLIVSGNFMAQLFPCRVQKLLTENMFLKHIFGVLTLFIFGVRAMSDTFNLTGFMNSVILYLVFAITAKTNHYIWFCLFFIYAGLYILHIAISDYSRKNKKEPSRKVRQNAGVIVERMKWVQKAGIIAIPCLTTFGVILYLGEKKLEYGKHFNYLAFLTGKPACAGNTKMHDKSMLAYIRAAFSTTG